ncbi:MATE family efflux transporter [Enterobacteriaceae endosymbiont of Donacia bicoloricornis]|uniref:MATE family efflux transporter n=1 Tax=Enterobacteriaceae endosymbiont of Donacia bicoloricornis TaxID=2675772 RepID=UPI0014494AA5|nr:MATE family efflux transporter [Enterobacteriaceae endosymbiont of Donacia bicoloricornis]QJC37646.1 MATE family efflux transporter [Enterobacteriaceae endosymbiont of Donacia bicoloricornis]
MQKYLIEIKKLFNITIPIILTQIAYTLISIINMIMSSSFNKIDITVLSIGISIWLPIILFGNGIFLSLIPIITKLYISKNNKKIINYIKQSYLLVIILSFIMMFALYQIKFLISLLFYNKIFVLKIKKFLNIIIWSIPGYLLLQILRCICISLSLTIPDMIISWIGVILYIPINYILIHGFNYIPSLGVLGCSYAIVLIYWILFIITIIWMSKSVYFKKINFFNFSKNIDFKILKKILKIGIPIGLSVFFEIMLFSIISLLISYFMKIDDIISHQIAINFSSLIFIFPLSLSIATTLLIGVYLSLGHTNKAKIVSWISQITGIIISILITLISIFFRKKIATLYNPNKNIVNLSSHLILLASFYQFLDSIQIIGSGILKGYKDNKYIFFITFISYWIISLPIGYILSITSLITSHPMGPSGFWIGFNIGLVFSTLFILLRIIKIQKN